MRRRASVEIVTGFLGAGKTSFINSYIDITRRKDEEILIVQLENGKTVLCERFSEDKKITIKKFNNNNDLDKESLLRAIKFYNPERIIIENNGVCNLDKLIGFLKLRDFKKYISINSVITLIDGVTGELFIKNIAPIIMPNILAADLIIINNCSRGTMNHIDNLQSKLEELNAHAHILRSNDSNDIRSSLSKCSIIKSF